MTKERLAVFFLFVALTFFYLAPGSWYLLQGRSDLVLGDGLDQASAPYFNDQFLGRLAASPLNLIRPQVVTPYLGAPEGATLPLLGLERMVVLIFGTWMPVEQLSALWVFAQMLISALAMYALGRNFSWPRALSVGLAIAWAFSATTRARAVGDGDLVGLYHLPLFLLGLRLLAQNSNWRSVVGTSVLFLLAAMVATPYRWGLVLILPFWLMIFYCFLPTPRLSAFVALLFALVPAACVLGFADVPARVEDARSSLEMTAARPWDYFTGDTGLTTEDPLWLRQKLNLHNFEKDPVGSNQDRTQGIRWCLWFFACGSLFFMLRLSGRSWPGTKNLTRSLSLMLIFLAVGIFAFLLSLPPSSFLSLSALGQSLVPSLTRPSCAGVLVSFSILMITGLGVQAWLATKEPRFYKLLWLLPVLMILELPPLLHALPVVEIRPRYQALQGLTSAECGLGVRIPYVSPGLGVYDYNQFLQQMRGSNCPIVNTPSLNELDKKMIEKFGIGPRNIDHIFTGDARWMDEVARVSHCMNLGWIAFDMRIARHWQHEVCSRAGGALNEQGICRRSPVLLAPARIETCL